MPRELIAPAVGQLTFREFERPDLRAGYVRVKSLFGAAKHGTEMALFKGYALARGGYDTEYQIFRPGTEAIGYPIALQLTKLAGAYPVIGLDPLPIRRNIAAECGADLVLDPGSIDAGLEIKKATNKRGADVCIEYSGHYLALQAALRGVAYNGTVVAGA